MPLPVFALGAALASMGSVLARYLVPFIIVKALVGIGVTTFSIVGSIWLTGYIETTVTNQFSSIPGNIGQILLMAGFLDALTIIFNCWIAAIQIKTLKGAFKGLRFA